MNKYIDKTTITTLVESWIFNPDTGNVSVVFVGAPHEEQSDYKSLRELMVGEDVCEVFYCSNVDCPGRRYQDSQMAHRGAGCTAPPDAMRTIEVPADLVQYAISWLARAKTEGAHDNTCAPEHLGRVLKALEDLYAKS